MRKLRKHVEGQMIYVAASSSANRHIFSADDHCLFFIEKVAVLTQELNYHIHLLCLLPTSMHLVMVTSDYSISRFMHRLQTAYAVYFNRRNQTSGHVFARRFSDHNVPSNRSLLQLSRYIHLSPAFTPGHESLTSKEKLKLIRSYPWSSARGYLGVGARHKFISYSRILDLFNTNPLKATERYQQFLEAPLRNRRASLSTFITNPGLCLKTPTDHVGTKSNSRKPLSKNLVFDFALDYFSLQLFDLKSPHSFVHERAWVGIVLTNRCGLTQVEAATLLGWGSNAALSIQMRNLRSKAQNDKQIQNWMKANDDALEDFLLRKTK